MWTQDKSDGEPIGMFRNLDDEELEQFIKYAMEHDPHSTNICNTFLRTNSYEGSVWSLFHPICRMVWRVRGFVE